MPNSLANDVDRVLIQVSFEVALSAVKKPMLSTILKYRIVSSKCLDIVSPEWLRLMLVSPIALYVAYSIHPPIVRRFQERLSDAAMTID